MQACKNVASLLSGKIETYLVNRAATTQHLAGVKHQAINPDLAVVYDVPTGNYKGNDQLSHIIVFTIMLLIFFFT